MRGVINNVGRSRSLLITLTAHLSVTWHIECSTKRRMLVLRYMSLLQRCV